VVPALARGGGERIVVNLANWAAAAGHDVTVVAGSPAEEMMLRDDLRADVAVEYVSSRRSRAGRYLAIFGWLRRRRGWLQDQDIVHCHMTYGAVVGTMLHLGRGLGRFHGPVLVETYHAVGMPIPTLKRRLHAAMARRRDALVLMAEDPFWHRFLKRHPRLERAIIHNGIALPPRPVSDDERLGYRRAVGIPDEAVHVIGTIGRLNAERRPWLYPAAFAAVAARLGDGVHYLIGGKGPELGRVEAAIARHRLERHVHLPGFVADPALPLSVMDLYFTLNVGPVAGVAALEAAAAGVPVLGLQLVDGYEPGEEDWIWSSADPRAVGERAATLLADAPARAELARRQSAQVASRHSVEVMAQAYQSLYERLLERRAAPGAGQRTREVD